MRAGFLQFDVKKDMKENFEKIQKLMIGLDCDILVLPELSSCGYLFDDKEQLRASAERVPEGAFVQGMAELSKMHQCTIIAGVAEIWGKDIYNTAVVLDHGRYIGRYRKIHLSDYEKKLFKKGDLNEVFEVSGIRIGIQICFDLWFPEISREQMLRSADIFCALANFGGETTYHIARVRAIENLTPMVLCNRVGSEYSSTIFADFLGKSFIVDMTGERQISEVEKEEYSASCAINIARAKANGICRDFAEEIQIHTKQSNTTELKMSRLSDI